MSGPEKRRSTRVNIGAPVRLRMGWRRRGAILIDISAGGCRLACERLLEVQFSRCKLVRDMPAEDLRLEHSNPVQRWLFRQSA